MKRTIFTVITAVIAAASLTAAGERQAISGDVTGELQAGAYMVKSTITVPKSATLTIPAGTTIYFAPLTGINVQGALAAAGTHSAPVVLTSINDTAGAPAGTAQGFDWNGVKTQGADAALRLRHTNISHSVYGVSIRDPETKAALDSVTFDNNGYASLVRGELIIPVKPGEPISTKWNIEEITTDSITESAADSTIIPPKPICKHKSKTRLILNYTALGTTIAGTTIYAISLSQKNTYFKHYTRDDNSNRLSAYYEEKINTTIKTSTIGAVIAGVGIGGLTVTIIF